MNAKTRLFCVIGDPIEHSMSPAMHNEVFAKMNLNCAYAAFGVEKGGIGDAVKGMRALGIAGANVTIPHKVDVMKHLDSLSEEARIIGAVNTIEFGRELVGHNTDGMGALRALRNAGADPRGKKVLMLGSGGAARAIAVTLALEGNLDSMMILGIEDAERDGLVRDVERDTRCDVAGSRLNDGSLRRELEGADLLIHCTPVGMHPRVGETLVTAELMGPDLDVMDIVYNPMETRLLKEAREAGVNKAIGGVDMFVNQGAESLRIWLGIDAPVDLMRRVVADELSRG
ncbi:MAG: shikimate dehydrogenase [Candidatus Hydrothermarchaeaceae archaeon]